MSYRERDCPECGAGIGTRCMNADGSRRTMPHPGRLGRVATSPGPGRFKPPPIQRDMALLLVALVDAADPHPDTGHEGMQVGRCVRCDLRRWLATVKRLAGGGP